MIKRIVSVLLLSFLFVINVNASDIKLNSERYILYNLNDDNVLLEKKSNEETYIASLTKIMTIITSIENIDDFNDRVKITSKMLEGIERDVAVVGYEVGDIVTYNDLLYGAMLSSGADAANALALSVSNSYSSFIKLMNNRVNKLDLKHTHFANVTGLFDSDNYSSAQDMATILKYALKNKKFKEVFETKSYITTSGKKLRSTINMYNIENKDIKYITGSKTGYINKSGYCLATTATINDVNYLLITLNSYNGNNSHINDAINTYTYFSNNYSYQDIVSKGEVITKIDALYSKEDISELKSNKTISIYLPNNFDKESLSYDIDVPEKISYFKKNNSKVGTTKIYYNNEELGTVDLMYTGDLTFDLCEFVWTLKPIIFFVLLIIVILVLKKVKRKKSKSR